MPVYFIQAGGGCAERLIKIGYAENPQARLQTVQTWSPTPLVLLATAPGGVSLESRLHHHFRKARRRGEWFSPVPELRALIETVRATGAVPRDFGVASHAQWPGGRIPVAALELFLTRHGLRLRDVVGGIGLSRSAVGNWRMARWVPERNVPAIIEFLAGRGLAPTPADFSREAAA